MWLQVSEHEFYDSESFAIVPKELPYQGRGKSGDLPPLKECAPINMRAIIVMVKM